MIAPNAVGAPAARIDNQPLVKGKVAYEGVDLQSGIEGFLRFPTADELHAGEKPQTPDVPHDGMPVQNLQLFK